MKGLFADAGSGSRDRARLDLGGDDGPRVCLQADGSRAEGSGRVAAASCEHSGFLSPGLTATQVKMTEQQQKFDLWMQQMAYDMEPYESRSTGEVPSNRLKKELRQKRKIKARFDAFAFSL